MFIIYYTKKPKRSWVKLFLFAGIISASLNATDHWQTQTITTSTDVHFKKPYGAHCDASGNIYVADTENNRICKVDASSHVVSIIAGSGSKGNSDGVGTNASFWMPYGVYGDASGNMYVADMANNRIRKLVHESGSWTVSTIASDVGFEGPSCVTSIGDDLYVTDLRKHRICKLVQKGDSWTVSTIAGGSQGNSDGIGTEAKFGFPQGITSIDKDLYVADTMNNRICKLVQKGDSWTVSTIAGGFGGPLGITSSGADLYVADSMKNRICKLVQGNGSWTVSTIAGDGTAGFFDSIDGQKAKFFVPAGITSNGSDLYVVDNTTGFLRKLTNNGVPTTLEYIIGNDHGIAAIIKDGEYTYTPPKGFSGTDTFTCTVNELLVGRNPKKISTVKINVTIPKPEPISIPAVEPVISPTVNPVITRPIVNPVDAGTQTDDNKPAVTPPVNTKENHKDSCHCQPARGFWYYWNVFRSWFG